jgi:hypothetical protein
LRRASRWLDGRLFAGIFLLLIIAGLAFSSLPGAARDIWLAARQAPDLLVVVSRLSRPGSGADLVPDDARSAMVLLQQVNTDTYRLSPALIGKDATMRIMEVLWPIRFDEKSALLLLKAGEPSPCPISATLGDLAVARCR